MLLRKRFLRRKIQIACACLIIAFGFTFGYAVQGSAAGLINIIRNPSFIYDAGTRSYPEWYFQSRGTYDGGPSNPSVAFLEDAGDGYDMVPDAAAPDKTHVYIPQNDPGEGIVIMNTVPVPALQYTARVMQDVPTFTEANYTFSVSLDLLESLGAIHPRYSVTIRDSTPSGEYLANTGWMRFNDPSVDVSLNFTAVSELSVVTVTIDNGGFMGEAGDYLTVRITDPTLNILQSDNLLIEARLDETNELLDSSIKTVEYKDTVTVVARLEFPELFEMYDVVGLAQMNHTNNSPATGHVMVFVFTKKPQAHTPENPTPPDDTGVAAEHTAYLYGYRDYTVRAYTPILRCELAALLYRLSGSAAQPQSAPGIALGDVPEDAWYAQAAQHAVVSGSLTQDAPGVFAPQRTVTRAEFARAVSLEFGVPDNVLLQTFDQTVNPFAAVRRGEAVVLLNKISSRRAEAGKIPAGLEIYTDIDPADPLYADIMEASIDHSAILDLKGGERWVRYGINRPISRSP